MRTRIVTMMSAGDAAAASAAIIASIREKLGGDAPALVAVFASTAQPLGDVIGAVAAAFPGSTTIGASTAGEFTEAGDAKASVSAFALAGDFKVFAGLGRGLKEAPDRAIEDATRDMPREVDGYAHRTAILLLDPLSGAGEEATLLAATALGEGVRLAGGAAGDDLAMKSTLVACGKEAAGDAIVLATIFSKQPVGVGAQHGHTPISKALKITKASGNVVHEIEGRPAWDVWVEHTSGRAKGAGLDPRSLARGDEGAYLLRYEASLEAGDGALKIRAPLSRADDGSIAFACGIAEGSVIRLTEGTSEAQIASAREAARRARAQLGGAKPAGALVFDCICRNLILGAAFGDAVRGMSAELGGAPIAGFETYGEIALDDGDMSGFHNTTSVVLAFPES